MDSLDVMPATFHLPKDTTAGDYIEIFGAGAYGWGHEIPVQFRRHFRKYGGA